MDPRALHIDDDIRRARTLPPAFFADAGAFAACRERVFARSWQFVGDVHALGLPAGACVPVTLLPGLLDEPLLLTRPAGAERARSDDAPFSAGDIACLSNVCTHRGLLLCEAPRAAAQIQCRYHGRRFALDGRMLGAPEFEGAQDFPSDTDHLRRVPLQRWGPLLFASLDPVVLFAEWIHELDARTGWLPLAQARLDPTRSRDYRVRAHWALYCDNYLEGFHIPFVHPGLAGALDYGGYRTELFAHSNLQVGVASPASGDGETPAGRARAIAAGEIFDLPRGSPDFGQAIAGYYFWLFPDTMVNVYPWGLSLNVVKPVAPDECVVSFLSYVWDARLLDRGAGADLQRVEREDESVVEAVQRGVRSRLYPGGRYSPAREACVHHFHRLLAAALRAE